MLKDRKEVTVTFTVDAEWVPGLFYDPTDFVSVVTRDICYTLQSYKPEILFAEVKDHEGTMP